MNKGIYFRLTIVLAIPLILLGDYLYDKEIIGGSIQSIVCSKNDDTLNRDTKFHCYSFFVRKLEYFRYEFNKNNVIIKNSLVDIVINWPFHHRVIFADGPESGHHGVIYYKNENLDRSSIHKCTLSAFAYGKEWIYECWEDKGTSRKAFLFEDEEVDEAYLNIIRQTNPLVEQGKNRLMWAKPRCHWHSILFYLCSQFY